MLTTLKIAWRNLGRHRTRTALAVLAIAVGQLALLAMNGVMRGYLSNIRNAITGPFIGHAQVHHPEWREERAMDLTIQDSETVVKAIRQDPAVRNAGARIYAPVLVAPERDAFAAVVVGVELDVESQTYGLLSSMQDKLRPQHVLLGYRLATKIKAREGQEIAIVGQGADGSLANDLYVVQQIIKCDADLVNQVGIVMSLDDAQQLMIMDGQAHEIVIRTKDPGQAFEFVQKLKRDPAFKDFEVNEWREIVPELVTMLEMADYASYFVLGLVFIAAIAGIANTLMMSTFERMHEFGMLLGLGARPSRLVKMIVVEALLLGVLGVMIGTALGYGFTAYFGEVGINFASWSSGGQVKDMAVKGLNLPLNVFPQLVWFDSVRGLIAVIVTSLIAATWPAYVAARLEPMEAMRS